MAGRTPPDRSNVTTVRKDVVLEKGKLVGAVSVAIGILEYLARQPQPVGVTRIAGDLGLNASTTFNTLKTLAAHDYVVFQEASKSYRIGFGLLHVARSVGGQNQEFELMRTEIEAIASRHGVTLAVWRPLRVDRKVLIYSFQPAGSLGISIQMSLGQRLPLLVGSSGRLFAAFGKLDLTERQRQFNQIRWQKPLTFDEFEAEVTEAREQGHAIDPGNYVRGTAMISVPILGGERTAVMALSAMMFIQQYEESDHAELIADVKRVAAQLSRIRGT